MVPNPTQSQYQSQPKANRPQAYKCGGTWLLLLLLLAAACIKQQPHSYKLAFIQDSAKPRGLGMASKSGELLGGASFVGQVKAAQLALNKFNAHNNINGCVLQLEVLDLAKIELDSPLAVKNYVAQLQNGQQQRTVLVGFVMGSTQSQKMQQFRQILGEGGFVLVGTWDTQALPARETQPLQLNIARPPYASNEYLVEYIAKGRGLNTVYVVYDGDHTALAEDFLVRSRAAGLNNVAKLQYIAGSRPDYDQGIIQGLADLLRNQKNILQKAKSKSAIVLFLNWRNIEQSNQYLAKSVYRYFFNTFEVFLNTNEISELQLRSWSNPKSPAYFMVQRQDHKTEQQNYQKFHNEYSQNYHLRMSGEVAEIYDAVTLLAYAAKKTIENTKAESELSSKIYQNLLQQQLAGATGHLAFEAQGKATGSRIANYRILRWTEKSLEAMPFPN